MLLARPDFGFRYTAELTFVSTLRVWVQVRLVSLLFVLCAVRYWLSAANCAAQQTLYTGAV
jgi:hypothetical protein